MRGLPREARVRLMADDDYFLVVPLSDDFHEVAKAAKLQKFLNWRLRDRMDEIMRKPVCAAVKAAYCGPDNKRWPPDA